MPAVFSNKHISLATPQDAVAITHLLNSAYRGEASKKGWTTEAHLIAGDVRSNVNTVLETMQKKGSLFLKYSSPGGTLTGCVNLQQQQHKLYLGMFSVAPALQGAGTGRHLLQAAEEYARYLKCSCIYMQVISVRHELIQWYQRHGYKDTGIKIPFNEDGLSGRHLQPLEFMVLEKEIK